MTRNPSKTNLFVNTLYVYLIFNYYYYCSFFFNLFYEVQNLMWAAWPRLMWERASERVCVFVCKDALPFVACVPRWLIGCSVVVHRENVRIISISYTISFDLATNANLWTYTIYNVCADVQQAAVNICLVCSPVRRRHWRDWEGRSVPRAVLPTRYLIRCERSTYDQLRVFTLMLKECNVEASFREGRRMSCNELPSSSNSSARLRPSMRTSKGVAIRETGRGRSVKRRQFACVLQRSHWYRLSVRSFACLLKRKQRNRIRVPFGVIWLILPVSYACLKD